MTEQNNNQNDTVQAEVDTKEYEIIVSYVQPERALLRMRATSPEMAEAAIREMAGDSVRDLQIETIREAEEGTAEVAEAVTESSEDDGSPTVH